MKTTLALIMLCATCLHAQSAAPVEGVPIPLAFDHTRQFAAKLWTNGALVKTFPIGEVIPLGTNSYRILCPGLPRGTYTFTVSVVDVDGAESDPCPPIVLTVKPAAPGNFRKL